MDAVEGVTASETTVWPSASVLEAISSDPELASWPHPTASNRQARRKVRDLKPGVLVMGIPS
jgi:hypothetical protein